MLAKEFEQHERRVEYPCYVQPKLDGIRCVTDGRRFWSRNGKLFPTQNFEHLRLHRLPHLVDCELSMVGVHADFEDISSIVRRAGHHDAGQLCLNAFDVVTDEPFIVRKMYLRALFELRQIRIMSDRWNRLTTKKAVDRGELEEYHRRFLVQGYEGTMVRNAMGLYVPRRTHDLLKWKPLREKEFEIVDVVEAKGKDRGTPVFVCWTGQGAIDDVDNWFRVRPMGTTKQRRRMWRDRAGLLGCMLTVEFQNLTKYGIPRFPRAKALRDYE
jgi:ATP-dependent DNA ligase